MKLKEFIKWAILVIEIVIIVGLYKNLDKFREIVDPKVKQIIETSPTSPTKEIKKMVAPVGEVVKKETILPTPTMDKEPWGVAKQIDEVTWVMKVGEDEKMATVKEIFEALNEYRKVHGSQVLTWDEKLGNYAQNRAKYLNELESVDKHEGFKNFLENENGFDKLGFTSLGENISYGYRLNGTHIIEWMYAADKPHNDNQLDNRWNYVGIGVNGLATCLIFGTGKN